MLHTDKIYIAGHRGLVGSAVMRCLQNRGYGNLVTATHAECDLTDVAVTERFFREQKPEYVVMAAGRVGGIGRNVDEPAEMIFQNAAIATNTIRAAWKHDVKRFVYLGSSCVYPRGIEVPITESMLLGGPLEETNEFYAVAKILGIKMCQALRKQHGAAFFSVMPCNLYGPGDNFDLATCHVLPALIRKIHEAKINCQPEVTLWGDGTPRRQFLHADDLAEALLLLLNHPATDHDLINIGSDREVSIRALADIIRTVIGYDGELRFNLAHPNGVHRKFIDSTLLHTLGWREKIDLSDGIERTYEWYLENNEKNIEKP